MESILLHFSEEQGLMARMGFLPEDTGSLGTRESGHCHLWGLLRESCSFGIWRPQGAMKEAK